MPPIYPVDTALTTILLVQLTYLLWGNGKASWGNRAACAVVCGIVTVLVQFWGYQVTKQVPDPYLVSVNSHVEETDTNSIPGRGISCPASSDILQGQFL
jgi:hypothetical protein